MPFKSKICIYCSKEITVKCTRDIERKKFCSHSCRQKWRYDNGESNIEKMHLLANTKEANEKKGHRGEQHPRYIVDRSKLKVQRGIMEERHFFKEILQEKEYKCEITGDGGKLSVHHINGVWSHPELQFDKTNCIVILKLIHDKFHKIYGNRSTESDWKEFIEKREYEGFILPNRKRNFVPYEDKTGMFYGRLTVLYKNDKKWRCKCMCGKEVDVASNQLNSGKTKSCVCLMREINSKRMKELRLWELSPLNKKSKNHISALC